MSEIGAGNIQARDADRGSQQPGSTTAPYHDPGSSPQAGAGNAADGAPSRPAPSSPAETLPRARAMESAFSSPPADTSPTAALTALAQPVAAAPVQPAGSGMQPRLPTAAEPPPHAPAAGPTTLAGLAGLAAPGLAGAPPVRAQTAADARDDAYGRAGSPPGPAEYGRAATPTPPTDYGRAATPPAPADYGRAATPPAPADYGRAATPPAPADYGRAATPPAHDDELAVLSAPVAEQAASFGGPQPTAVVKGRVQIEDEVVEKVAGLAAVEVDGVADLGGNVARALEAVREHVGVGHKRATQGVRARIEDRQVSIHVVIVIEYGAVVMDVARAVKANVARAVNHMLGLRVVEVNVTVDDVAMPQRAQPGAHAADRKTADEDVSPQ